MRARGFESHPLLMLVRPKHLTHCAACTRRIESHQRWKLEVQVEGLYYKNKPRIFHIYCFLP